jgi:hypothetical protein
LRPRWENLSVMRFIIDMLGVVGCVYVM